MPLYKKIEFARECGVDAAYITVNTRRKKVVINEDGMVDSTHPVNVEFMKKMQAKKKKAPIDEAAEPDPAAVKRTQDLQEIFDLDRQAKRLALESKKKEQALLDAKIQKMHGVLIPTDLVKVLFAQHFREVNTSFKQGIDGILSEIGKKSKLNGNQMAEIRATMVKILNECINKAVESSKKSVQNVVSEYQTTKNAA